MANMILATPVISDAALLSSSAMAGSLPLENLKKQAVGRVARFTSPDSAFIVIDLGNSPSAVDLIALIGHNASAAGEARVRAADAEALLTSAPSYDSGALRLRSNIVAPAYADVGSLARNHFILKLAVQQIRRYWRIDMTDTSISYLDVGRLYLSKVFQPSTNMDYGIKEGFIDPSTIQRTVSGRVIPNERTKYRYTELTLSFGSEAEMFGSAFDIEQARGSTRDVLLVIDNDNKPLLQKRSIYGLMATLNPVVNSYIGLFEKTYRIEEIIE